MTRIWLVTLTLMRQNRVLLSLLLLWPFLLSAILLLAEHGAPASEDAAAILQQELFYGLVLVGLGAASAFGTELRARRIQQVLTRAVSRTGYLSALGLSVYLPFAGYTLVWLLNAAGFAWLLHQHQAPVWLPFLAELAAGLLICSAGLFFSVVMPPMLAVTSTGLALAVLLGAGTQWSNGVLALFSLVEGRHSTTSLPWQPLAETAAAIILVTTLAGVVFARKDIKTA